MKHITRDFFLETIRKKSAAGGVGWTKGVLYVTDLSCFHGTPRRTASQHRSIDARLSSTQISSLWMPISPFSGCEYCVRNRIV